MTKHDFQDILDCVRLRLSNLVKTASPNLLNQGVFEYFLIQFFYNPILVVFIGNEEGTGKVGNVKINARMNILMMTVRVLMHICQNLLIDLVDQ